MGSLLLLFWEYGILSQNEFGCDWMELVKPETKDLWFRKELLADEFVMVGKEL